MVEKCESKLTNPHYFHNRTVIATAKTKKVRSYKNSYRFSFCSFYVYS